ncbi:MAG: fibronectin type III domain-containing protein, partial [Methanomassiliicoccales archaeon]|nr:fibronectin type III domain-containing protein [Methanomassiliicoccales archaeon]
LGLVAPTTGTDWIAGTNSAIRGHAYPESNFPSPGGDFNGLTMGIMGGGVPSAPISLYAIAGNARVDLNWGGPISEGGQAVSFYNLYRATEEDGTYVFLTSPTSTHYEDINVINGHTYWYEVSAVNPSGEGPKAGPVNSTPSPLPPAGFTRYSSGKGYSMLIPNGWTTEEDHDIGNVHYDTFITGPISNNFQTNVFVMSGSDTAIVDTEAYLDGQAQSLIAELQNQGFVAVMTGTVQHTTISNRSAVVFGYDISGISVHQKIACIIDAQHKHFWIVGCSASVDSMSELEPKFNAMLYGFTISSVSDPTVTSGDTTVVILVIVVCAAAAMVAILLVAWRRRSP